MCVTECGQNRNKACVSLCVVRMETKHVCHCVWSEQKQSMCVTEFGQNGKKACVSLSVVRMETKQYKEGRNIINKLQHTH